MNQDFKNELAVVALGCLMHDIGKVIQRADEDPMKKSHSAFGAEFLEKSELLQANKYWQWVYEGIKYHHWRHIKEGAASLPIAWFVFEADNLASAHDREEAPEMFSTEEFKGEYSKDEETYVTSLRWDKARRLDSVFTYFRQKDKNSIKSFPLWYRRKFITDKNEYTHEPYPYPSSYESVEDTTQDYQKIRDKVFEPLFKHLKDANPTDLKTVNLVLSTFEENLSMVPPDTYIKHTNDVSLYDHLKLTTAIGTAMYSFVQSEHADWLAKGGKNFPWDKDFKNEQAFLLVKADISGIQDFIYNISSKKALKSLRGRSYYLELLQSCIVDNILETLGLSKANLIYQGGGGFVLLVANNKHTKDTINSFRNLINKWLLDQYNGKLFLGLEFASLKATEFRTKKGVEKPALSRVWNELSEKLGQSKNYKFIEFLDDVFKIDLNEDENIRECRVCYKDTADIVKYSDDLDQICFNCANLIELGSSIPKGDCENKNSFKLVLCANKLGERPSKYGVVMPNIQNNFLINKYARLVPENQINEFLYSCDVYPMHDFDRYQRPKLFWSLNQFGDDFLDLSEASCGVKRLGILRADIDNLGKIFSGLSDKIGLEPKYRSLSRDAAVSRSLAKFFTHYLDDMLTPFVENSKNNKDHLEYCTTCKVNNSGEHTQWAITTVYSGGDDLFLVGAWNQIIDFALIFESRFKEYTQGKIKLSAGISIHDAKYPLYRMAEAGGMAEKVAKNVDPLKDKLCVYFDERIDINKLKPRVNDNFGVKPEDIAEIYPSHTFTWGNWKTVSNKVLELEILRKHGIPDGFFHYLLTAMREANYSFYRFLYNLVRMEERVNGLASTEEWKQFKEELISKNIIKVRNKQHLILETALNWFILLKRTENHTNQTANINNKSMGVV